MDQTTKILEEVIELISRPDGWCQGSYSRWNGDGELSYCIRGAVMKASTEEDGIMFSPGYTEAIKRISEAVPKISNKEICPIVIFNDSPETTQEDVILLLKKAVHLEND